jgi:hypothetical protein
VKTGGEALGKYSAEIALKGFYEVINSNSAIFRILSFDGIDAALEYRVAGWIIKALELANCREPAYHNKSAISNNDSETAILFSWK